MKAFLDKMKTLNDQQRMHMEFLCETMPESDEGYPFELLLSVVDHSLMLRELAPWCAALPDWMFREYVLYHRVNDEDLSNMRPVFFEELWGRVEGLDTAQATLEVNRWCHEKATYQEQDDRTASPATVYRSGSGRCGEESAFAVTALRSVGIAARQVYAPRWSHCDDNHAWVEAFCDGRWRFFGACEPEPVLDKGWFNTAASRAMIVHTRTFGEADRDSEALGSEGTVRYWNQTGRYANTKIWTFQAVKEGRPIKSGGRLRLSVLNESRFMTVAELDLDGKGQASIEMGLGDVWAEVCCGGMRAEQLCRGTEFSSFTIEVWSDEQLQEQKLTVEPEAELEAAPGTVAGTETGRDSAWEEFDFLAPTGSGRKSPVLTAEEKREREETNSRGNKIREARLEAFEAEGQKALSELMESWAADRRAAAARERLAEGEKLAEEEKLAEGQTEEAFGVEFLKEIFRLSRGNWQELLRFLQPGREPERILLLQQLSHKDYRDVTADVLEDHLVQALPHKERYAPDVFHRALLNPRIAFERLTAFRTPVLELIGEDQAEQLRQSPFLVTQYLWERMTVAETGERIYPSLYFDPLFALENGRCDERSLKVLAVALLRCAGVPSRLSRKDQLPEYYDSKKDAFVKLPWARRSEAAQEKELEENRAVSASGSLAEHSVEKPAKLILKKEAGQVFFYRQNWSLSRLTDKGFSWLDLSEESFADEKLTLTLAPGAYRLLTVSRLPKGDQLAASCILRLQPGEEREINMHLRSYSVEDMLGEYELPVFSARDEKGVSVDSQELVKGKPLLLFWLEEGAEPTEHVVNEWIAELQTKESKENPADVILLLKGEESKKQRTLAKLLSVWPQVRVLLGDWEFNMELVARHLSCNPEQPPLAVVVSSRGKCVYGSSGYNVGLVKLLIEMAKLTENVK